MARNTGKTSRTRTTASKGAATARARAAKTRPAATGWRAQVEQLVSTSRQAAEFVQRQGTSALELVQRRGNALSQQARTVAEQRLETVAEKVVGAWDSVEQVATARVGRTLNRLGVPSQKDIDRLTRSVTKLSAQIEQLAQSAPRAAARGTGRRAATAAAS